MNNNDCSERRDFSRAENINPSMLRWARENAGLDIQCAAQLLGFTSTKESTAIQKLSDIESGIKSPTRKQLLEFASKYRYPLTIFYCSTPPKRGDRGMDFRVIDRTVSPRDEALLDAVLRDVYARQEMVKAILEDDEDSIKLEFVGSVRSFQNPIETANVIRQILGVDDVRSLWKKTRSPDDLFNELRGKTEDTGVFVLLIGNVASHHTNIRAETFRGFAIADEIAPFIVINEQAAQVARSFTLIHELTHLLSGSTGICPTLSELAVSADIADIETFCNDVAGEFLLPTESLRKIKHFDSLEAAKQTISVIADERKVSESLVAYRLWRDRRISRELFMKACEFYDQRWDENKIKRSRQNENLVPNYHTIQKQRLGDSLIKLVGRSLRTNELTHTKAAKMLGINVSSVEPLLESMNW